ncbi:DUF559 domain-containing protein [Agromyces sp. NPDC058484]|uniref:DUF559 domain-containing protein n=1 Tax=Agromyces sp. NPDC058484 TaxID=3346524 RepID=UPI003652E18E
MPHTPDAVARYIRANTGALSYRDLDEAGVERSAVAAALATGRVTRIRRGWFGVPDAPHDVVRAVRVGGVVTAASAARLDGLWLHDDPVLHVRVPRTSARLRSPDAAHVRLDREAHQVCVHYRSDPPVERARDPLPIALAEMLSCADAAHAITTIDSALAHGPLDEKGLRRVRSLTLPSRHPVLDQVSAGSESGIETKVRLLLRSRRIRHRTQVHIPRVGYVDLLVGDRLVIEVDGKGFHTGPEFEEDRRRDFELVMQGYLVLRLSYHLVTNEWAVVSEGLRALVDRGAHRWGARTEPAEPLATALKKRSAG